MHYQHHIPPCDGDCEHCQRPVDKCHGMPKNKKTAFVDGTQPRQSLGKGDFGAVHFVGSTKIFSHKHP